MLDAVESERITIPDLYVRVLGPFLAHIGSSWAHGNESVWEEHLASHIVLTIVEALYPTVMRDAAEVPAADKTVLLACPPQERHEIGLRMLSDRFELAGWNVTNLGADTPLPDIIAAAQATSADLVALSVSTVYERVELRRFIDSLRKRLPGTASSWAVPRSPETTHGPPRTSSTPRSSGSPARRRRGDARALAQDRLAFPRDQARSSPASSRPASR